MKSFDTETFFYDNYEFDSNYEQVITKLACMISELIDENQELRSDLDNLKDRFEGHWYADNQVQVYEPNKKGNQ